MKIVSNDIFDCMKSTIKQHDETLIQWRDTLDRWNETREINNELLNENRRLEKRLLESLDRIDELVVMNKELLSIIRSGIQVELMTKAEEVSGICS